MIAARRAQALLGAVAILVSGLVAVGCSGDDEDTVAQPAAVTNDVVAGCEPTDGAPTELRCTGLYADFGAKTVSPRARSFTPAVAFWSDGAEKQRWVDLPDGTKIDTASMDEWKYPVGTKVWKEFKASGKRVETRFMHKVRDDRWLLATYVWSPDEATAMLKSDGAQIDLGGGKSYVVPRSSQCNECHKGKKDKLLGFEAISLAQPGAAGLTLGVLVAEGRLTAPPTKTTTAIADDGTGHAPAALAWLHVNCGTSCHTGTSTATAYGTGLRLRIGWDEISGKPPAAWEVVKSTLDVPVKSPKWAGEPRIASGDPEASVLLQLLGQRGPEQMPPIATRVVDEKGKAAVLAWVAALPKKPAEAPPPADPPPPEDPPAPAP